MLVDDMVCDGLLFGDRLCCCYELLLSRFELSFSFRTLMI